mgnify:CR=1 FL=1
MSGKLRSYKIIILLFLFSFIYITTIKAQERYWVNGSGSWNDTEHWAETSGGNGGAEIPTKNDDVIIDKNSFSKTGQYIKIDGKATCNDLILKETLYKPVLKSRSFIFKKWTNAKLQVHGSVQLPEKLENKYFGDIILKSGHENNTIDISNNLYSDIIFDGKGGEWILNNKLKTTGNIQLKRGDLKTKDQNIMADEFIGSGDKKRSLTLGSSELAVKKWKFEDSRNLEYDAQQSSILFRGNDISNDFKPGGLPYNRLTSYKKTETKAGDVVLTAYTDSVSCNGGSDGVIYMLASGGSGEYLYQVEDVDGNILDETTTTDDSVAFTGYSAGTYYLHLEDANDDTNFESKSRTVYEPDAVSIDYIECIQPLSCYNSSDAELKAHPSGGTEPYTKYTWKVNGSEVGSDSSVVTGIARGDLIEVKVTDANGCESDFITTRFIEDFYPDCIPSKIDITTDNVTSSCTLTENGELSLSASGGSGDKDFRIVATSRNDTIPPPPNWDEDGDFTGLAPDTYETFAIDTNGCIVQGADVTVDSITQTKVISDPKNNTACEGTVAIFGVEAEGENLSYTWESSPDGTSNWSNISGSNIYDANTDSLTIDPVSNSDELFYRVYVDGDCGDAYSDIASLTVDDTVEITSHPADKTVCEGEEANFSVSATGEGTLNYQWQTDASGSWEDISGAENDTYTIPEVSNSNSGQYRVEVSNNCGVSTSEEATLTVNDTIEITNQPESQTACEGEDVTLSATAEGNVTGYQWETDISGSWQALTGETNDTYTIADAENSDEGNYRLIIEGACEDDTTNEVNITVEDTVVITNQPANQTVCEGEEASFSVSATGEGTLNYQWQTDASGSWENISGAENDTYTIPEVSNSNAGQYRVEVSNNCGVSTSEEATLTVNDTVEIIEHPEDQLVCDNENVTFDVNAEGYGSLTYTWEYNDGSGWEALTTTGDITVDEDTLTIANADTTDEGNYRCIIENSCGSDTTKTANLQINWLEINIGEPSPFTVDTNSTLIKVHVAIKGHIYLQDLSYELINPEKNTVLLADSGNIYEAQYLEDANLTFRSDYSNVFDVTSDSPNGTYGFSDDISSLHGKDPSNGAWGFRVADWVKWNNNDPKGYIDSVYISFTDEHSQTGDTTTVSYNENTNNKINEYKADVAYTEYTVDDELSVDCYGDSTATAIISTFGGIAPFSIEWSTTSDFSSTIPDFANQDTVDLWAGTFYVRVIDDLGCVALDSVTVTQPPEIIIDSLDIISIDDLNGCHGDSIGEVHDSAYGGTGNLRYELIKDPFSEPDTIGTNTSGDFTGLAAGFYALEVFDENGCLKDTTFEITQPDSINILYEKHKPLTHPDSTDGEINIYAEGGTSPLTYTLYDSIAEPDSIVETVTPADTAHFTNLPESDYYVVVSDSNDCDSTQSSIFYIGPMQVILSIDSTLCPAGSNGEIAAEVIGGISPFTYQWTKLPSNDTLRILEDTITSRDTLKDVPSGEYVLNVIDDNDFNLRDTIKIPDKIEIDSITVNPSTYDLDAWASGGNDSLYIYVQGQKSDSIIYPDTASYNPAEGINFAGFNGLDTDTYKIIATDSLCQADTLTIRIPITVEMSILDSIECYGDANGRIEATVSGSDKNKPYTYQWSNSVTNISNNDKDTITGINADTYYITVTDTYGLSAVDSITLPEPPQINITDTTIIPAYCKEGQTVLDNKSDTGAIYIEVEGGRPYKNADYKYTYQWEEAEDSVGGLDSLTNKTSGSYTVTVSDRYGCEQTEEYYLPYDSTLALDAEAGIIVDSVTHINEEFYVCPSDSVDLQAISLSNVKSAYWQPIQNKEKFIPIEDFEDTLRVEAIDGINYVLVAQSQRCKATPKAGVTYFHDSPELRFTTFNGRDIRDTDTVNILEKDETANITAEAVDSLASDYTWGENPDYFQSIDQLTAVLNINAVQEAGYNKTIVSIETETNDTSEVTDLPCTFGDYLEVNIIPDVKPVDAFSPNGDGNNDEWLIKYGSEYEDLEVIIFNRWGGKVYRQKGGFDEEISYKGKTYIKTWDGKTKGGRDLPTGTYYYIIDPHVTGVQTLKGTVTIIR